MTTDVVRTSGTEEVTIDGKGPVVITVTMRE